MDFSRMAYYVEKNLLELIWVNKRLNRINCKRARTCAWEMTSVRWWWDVNLKWNNTIWYWTKRRISVYRCFGWLSLYIIFYRYWKCAEASDRLENCGVEMKKCEITFWICWWHFSSSQKPYAIISNFLLELIWLFFCIGFSLLMWN